ncbi:Uncharacterised protein [Mycobacteroides abscessus subsp. abscessus]|nr:Uncharacterised protein [Mycobacteroides abscessus subsp. abscessus]SKW79552.1 Uncharacterised protein [Mycobacteroides abscessus subsp. abscessus]
MVTCSPGLKLLIDDSCDGAQSKFAQIRLLSTLKTEAANTAAPTSRLHCTRPILVTTMVNLGCSPAR